MRATSLAVCATLLTLAACSDYLSPGDAYNLGTGFVQVRLTDAPMTDSVARADIYVTRIDARLTEADSAAAAEGADGTATNGWLTLANPNKTFDLVALSNGTLADLGVATLTQGSYQALRLIIDTDQSMVTLKDGTILSSGPGDNPGIMWPGAGKTGIKILMKPMKVTAGDTTIATIDFDLTKSFVMRGNSISKNGLLFKPVIKAAFTR